MSYTRSPPLKHLKTFHIAARHCSFKTAADDLCITASAVSHQMKELERQLGVALFDRGTRTLTLTPAGIYFLEQLESLFSRLDVVTEQLQHAFNRTIVRLNAPPFFASELLLPRLAQYGAAHLDTDLQIVTHLAPHETHATDADVSILLGTGHWPDVEASALFPQTYVPACAPSLTTDHDIRTVAEIVREPLLVHEGRFDLWARWAALSGVEGVHPRQLFWFDTMTAMVHAAERGMGIGLVSAPLAGARFKLGSLCRLFETELATGESYYVVARPADARRTDVSTLIQWLLQQFNAYETTLSSIGVR